MTAVALPQPGDLALTYKQPWASLVVAGVKPVENRGWPPPKTLPQWSRCPLASCGHTRAMMPDAYTHGGAPVCIDHMAPSEMIPDGPFPFRLWVHAGATNAPINSVPAIALEAWRDTFGEPYVGAPYRLRGVLIGSVLVVGCHHDDEPQNPRHLGAAPRWCEAPDTPGSGQCSPWAEEGAYHWLHADPQPLDEPIPMRGRQKLWRITADDLAVAG